MIRKTVIIPDELAARVDEHLVMLRRREPGLTFSAFARRSLAQSLEAQASLSVRDRDAVRPAPSDSEDDEHDDRRDN
jgi:hypothetical protein